METNETFLVENSFTRTGVTVDDIPQIRRRMNYSTWLLELELMFIILVARTQTLPDDPNLTVSPFEGIAISHRMLNPII
jgi:hypothetical protein